MLSKSESKFHVQRVICQCPPRKLTNKSAGKKKNNTTCINTVSGSDVIERLDAVVSSHAKEAPLEELCLTQY